MMTSATKLLVAGLLVTASWAMHPTGGHAQGWVPPMDMSGAVRMQNALGWQGYYDAMRAGQNYLATASRLRAAGYYGPLWAPSQQDLMNSINGANNAMQAYNRAQFYNSQRRSFATSDYNMRAIRGCWTGWNQYGQYTSICP
jgi:hypothetical protein